MKFLPRPAGESGVREYDFGNAEFNLARIELTDRYPKQGRVMNTTSAMYCYVERGSGAVEIEGTRQEFKEGDVLLIEPHERYFWTANATLIIASTPAWTKEQARPTD